MIFVLFKPLDIKKQEFIDIPLFELQSFTLFELNNKGLTTVMKGSSATKFSDRYSVENIDYTDNSVEYIASMRAKYGLYKNDTVDLKGDIVYQREDGLTFETQKATYNKKSKIAHVNTDFIAYRGDDMLKGSSMTYNNLLNRAKSTDIVAKYQLQENSK